MQLIAPSSHRCGAVTAPGVASAGAGGWVGEPALSAPAGAGATTEPPRFRVGDAGTRFTTGARRTAVVCRAARACLVARARRWALGEPGRGCAAAHPSGRLRGADGCRRGAEAS